MNEFMKKNIFFISFVLLIFVSSCDSLRLSNSSRFVLNAPQLGMNKADFVSIYGAPFRQNVFYDEQNVYCEELVYREEIEHGGNAFRTGEFHALNSIFLFKNGKLVSQFQEDDVEYQIKLEKQREQNLIREKINAEKERAAAERARADADKERIEAEKNKK